ncbi:hypothetical protein BC826DRAFT_1041805, partial [Russula brevipes]
MPKNMVFIFARLLLLRIYSVFPPSVPTFPRSHVPRSRVPVSIAPSTGVPSMEYSCGLLRGVN